MGQHKTRAVKGAQEPFREGTHHRQFSKVGKVGRTGVPGPDPEGWRESVQMWEMPGAQAWWESSLRAVEGSKDPAWLELGRGGKEEWEPMLLGESPALGKSL